MSAPNPKLYRELSTPFASREAADAALAAFAADVRAAREKHRIRDVVCVVEVSLMLDETREAASQGVLAFGDQLRVPILLAMALARERNSVEDMIGEYLAKK